MHDDDIKRAYDEMNPTAEAEARMLDGILTSTDGSTHERKRKPLWTIALPLAACIVILAGIGVFASGILASDTKYTMSADAPDSTEEHSPTTQTPPNTSGGSSSGGTANSNDDYARRFPIIELKAGNTLHIVTSDGSVPLVIDETKIGEELGASTAHKEDGSDSMACTVFEYHDDTYPYAIRYQGDQEYHLAIPDKNQ